MFKGLPSIVPSTLNIGDSWYGAGKSSDEHEKNVSKNKDINTRVIIDIFYLSPLGVSPFEILNSSVQ
ncbi:MAG: hypothetical protein DHS20C18_40330 [Saprospiraceae bacterium]|nr:MAG: hypothetical protein DHS20C18_40330 [Saprospiraceae bacterium]